MSDNVARFTPFTELKLCLIMWLFVALFVCMFVLL